MVFSINSISLMSINVFRRLLQIQAEISLCWLFCHRVGLRFQFQGDGMSMPHSQKQKTKNHLDCQLVIWAAPLSFALSILVFLIEKIAHLFKLCLAFNAATVIIWRRITFIYAHLWEFAVDNKMKNNACNRSGDDVIT